MIVRLVKKKNVPSSEGEAAWAQMAVGPSEFGVLEDLKHGVEDVEHDNVALHQPAIVQGTEDFCQTGRSVTTRNLF